jgi:PKD repeat protein
MHKPCITVGRYICDPGSELFNMLLSKKVDLVLSGHEHTYQRSHQLGHSPTCTTLAPNAFNPGCVRDADGSFAAGAGTVAMVVGTGGRPLYDLTADDPEQGYFASTSGLNQTPTFGYLDVRATADSLQAGFVRASGAAHTDSFTITRGAPPAGSPPVASFTASCPGLTCSFDARASSDADGPIASYAWSFGDGITGTGPTASHSYAAAGSYSVTLTVTDAAGTSAQTTRNVAPTAPPTSALVDDQFSRTVASGLGSAPTGGAWTTTGAATNYAVANGLGTIRTAPASGPLASLNAVSVAGADTRLSFSLSQLPTGSGLYLSTHARRVAGAGSYLAKTRVTSAGVVTLELARTDTAGRETNVQPAVTVPGVTYVAGDQLNVRVQATGSAPTTLRAKVWRVGTPEPTTWQRSVTDSTAGLQGAGAVAVGSYLSGTAAAPVEVRLDSLVVTAP